MRRTEQQAKAPRGRGRDQKHPISETGAKLEGRGAFSSKKYPGDGMAALAAARLNGKQLKF